MSGLHIWAGERQISPELPDLPSKNLPGIQNVMIPHQSTTID